MIILSVTFIVVGTCFFIIGTIGLLRFPDFYTRMHAAGKCDTLGLSLILIGLALYNGLTLSSIKIIFIIIFAFIANPTAVHSLARAAFRCGIKPWEKNKSINKRTKKHKCIKGIM